MFVYFIAVLLLIYWCLATETCLVCCRKHLGFKRIMLFTNNDNPHPDDPQRVLHVSLLVNMLWLVANGLVLTSKNVLYDMNMYPASC